MWEENRMSEEMEKTPGLAPLTEAEAVRIAAQLLEEYRKAFLELAK